VSAPWWEQVRLAEQRRLERVQGWRGAKAQDRGHADWKPERQYVTPGRAAVPRPLTTKMNGRVVGAPPRTPQEQAARARDMLRRSAPSGWRVSGAGVARPAGR